MKDMAKGFTVPGKGEYGTSEIRRKLQGDKYSVGKKELTTGMKNLTQGYGVLAPLGAGLGITGAAGLLSPLAAASAVTSAGALGHMNDEAHGRLASDKNFTVRGNKNFGASDVLAGRSKDFTTQNTSGRSDSMTRSSEARKKNIIAKKLGALGK